MKGESDLGVGYISDASAAASPVLWLCPSSSDVSSDKTQLALALLLRLRTPYVLSSIAWCRKGDRELLILLISCSDLRKNAVGALLRPLRPGDV